MHDQTDVQTSVLSTSSTPTSLTKDFLSKGFRSFVPQNKRSQALVVISVLAGGLSAVGFSTHKLQSDNQDNKLIITSNHDSDIPLVFESLNGIKPSTLKKQIDLIKISVDQAQNKHIKSTVSIINVTNQLNWQILDINIDETQLNKPKNTIKNKEEKFSDVNQSVDQANRLTEEHMGSTNSVNDISTDKFQLVLNANLTDEKTSKQTNEQTNANISLNNLVTNVNHANHVQTQSSLPTKNVPIVQINVNIDNFDPPLTKAELNPGVINAIRKASAKTGFDVSFLMAIASLESNFYRGAQSGLSTGHGFLQYTDDGWKTAVMEHGANNGLTWLVAGITQTLEGHLLVRNNIFKTLMDLREDPLMSTLITGDTLKKSQQFIETKFNRSATNTDLYLRHVLGPTGVDKFLTAFANNQNQPCSSVIKAARNNPTYFAPNGHMLSIGDAYQNITDILAEKQKRYQLIFQIGPEKLRNQLIHQKQKTTPINQIVEANNVQAKVYKISTLASVSDFNIQHQPVEHKKLSSIQTAHKTHENTKTDHHDSNRNKQEHASTHHFKR